MIDRIRRGLQAFLGSRSGRSIALGAGTALTVQVLGAGVAYGLEVVLARLLGVADYGVYSYTLAWVTLLAIPTTLGFTTSLLRYVGAFHGAGEWGLLKGVVLRSWQLVLATSVLVVIVAVGAMQVLGHPPHASILFLALGLVPLTAVQNIQQSMGRGLGKVALAFAPGRIAIPTLLILLLLGTALFGRAVDPELAVWLTILAMALGLGGQALIIRTRVFEEAQPASYRTREWLWTSLPMLLIAGFMLVLARTDVLMLGFLAAPSDVGIYTAASRTSNLVLLTLTAVNALAAPQIADLFARDEIGDLQRIATGVAHLAFWPALLLVIMLLVAAPLVLGVFGSEFVLARGALTILALGNLVSVGVGSVGYFMNMTGNQNLMAVVVGVAAILNVVLNWLLIPHFGVNGAAGATAVSIAVWNLGLNAAVKRRVGVRPSIVHAVRRLVSSS